MALDVVRFFVVMHVCVVSAAVVGAAVVGVADGGGGAAGTAAAQVPMPMATLASAGVAPALTSIDAVADAACRLALPRLLAPSPPLSLLAEPLPVPQARLPFFTQPEQRLLHGALPVLLST